MALLSHTFRSAVRRLVLAAAAAQIACHAASAAAPSLEDEIKATYTYKFAPFVAWPPSARNGGAVTICVAGNDGVSAALPQSTAGQAIGGRAITVRHVGSTDVVDDCQILYAAPGQEGDDMLAAARGKPILTIRDGQGGAIIRFVVIDHHVRFDVDNRLAQESGLAISSKLLDLAHAVKTAENGP